MKCPLDQTDLLITERQGIEIDYCPQCRGVWLDRGELDKLIERGAQSGVPTTAPVVAPVAVRREDDDDYRRREGYERRDYGDRDDYRDDYKKRKRKGFLGELFDFD